MFLLILFPHRMVLAEQESRKQTIPSFEELEAAGAIIGKIHINIQDIFDLEDPKENNAFYRTANRLHISTRPSVIRHSLLFSSGDRVSARLIDETERLLHGYHFLYSATIHPVAYHDGIVDIEVKTRDTWSLEPGFSFSRSGGSNTSGFTLREQNLFGTGTALGYRNISNIDRNGTEFEILNNHALGGRYTAEYKIARLSDGNRHSLSLARPFYALDTRWAAGASVSQDDRIDPVYNSGILTGQYHLSERKIETHVGWSEGLIDGWVHRHFIGLSYLSEDYSPVSAALPPIHPPPDQRLIMPFFRYEVIEDSFKKLKNRDLIERPEFFAMGFQSSLQIGRGTTALGSTSDSWDFDGSISNGYKVRSVDNLLLSASLKGQYREDLGEEHLLSGSARYYVPESRHTLLFISVEGNTVSHPDIDDLLMLGGDNGLRGYPLRYQSGEHSALLTIERRAYTEWYPFRLLRVGGAVFFDVGRAWGGNKNLNTTNPGWLRDIGFGLRILSARSASGNLLHADIAFPLDRNSSIASFQFLLKTTTSY